MPSSPSQSKRLLKWTAYIKNDELSTLLKDLSSELDNMSINVVKDGLDSAIKEQSESQRQQNIIIDITHQENPLDKITQLAEVCYPGTYGIVIGDIDNVNFYRQLMDIGIDNYIVMPVSKEAMLHALERAFQEDESIASGRAKQVLVKGVSEDRLTCCVATNLACVLARQKKLDTVLVDWDFYFGKSTLAYDKEPNQGLVETLNYQERLDEQLLSKLLVKVDDKLSLLGAQYPLDQNVVFNKAGAVTLENLLNLSHDVIIHAVPHSHEMTQLVLNNQMDMIVLISDLGISALRDCARLKTFFQEHTFHGDVEVLIIKDKMPAGEQFSVKQFEEKVGCKVLDAIDNDYQCFCASLNHGKPLAETDTKHPLIKDMMKLSAILLEEDITETKGSLLSRLFKKD